MQPLKAYIDECRSQSKQEFSAAHARPFLVYSVVRGGNLKPADVSSGLTLDRLVLGDEVRGSVGGAPEDWYVVFEVAPRDESSGRAVLGCSTACDVRLNDASISRVHASLVREGKDYFIEDEDSSAGTAVNGELLEPHARAKLYSGQRISLGTVDLVFQLSPDFYDFVRLISRA